jgi:tubulin--tyrosine ligase
MVYGRKRTYIIQKYLEKPLLYKSRKFDIRVYAMTTTTNGNLQGYFYTEGYLRTSSREYNIKNANNRLIHLTNDAVQKKSDDYGKYENGNKVGHGSSNNFRFPTGTFKSTSRAST